MDKKKKKVLIVEDEEVLRKILSDFLRSETDWEILEAGDGQEAFEKIQTHHPDVGVFDISMPIMDGITLLKKVEAEKLGGDMKIIFLTNSGTLSDIASIQSPLVVGYFVKSNIDMREIMKKIEGIL